MHHEGHERLGFVTLAVSQIVLPSATLFSRLPTVCPPYEIGSGAYAAIALQLIHERFVEKEQIRRQIDESRI